MFGVTAIPFDSTTPLLGPDDPTPVNVQRAGAAAPFLIICDHAGREVPARLGRLGLEDAAFDRHIAWDIGAGALSDRLGEALDACVIRQIYSRLVIDCNRRPDRPDAMPDYVDETVIPGNVDLEPEEKAARIAEIHAPYHAAVAAELDDRAAHGRSTFVVMVHSFTPTMGGVARPWKFGVLHEGNSALSRAMLAQLGHEDVGPVGDNQPYAMTDDGFDYSAPVHALARGLDYLELEVRQDLLSHPEGIARVGDMLARLLPRAAYLATV